jgi:hypothetical protein
MTIPSALALLVRVFPEPLEQARAIGVLGGCGAVADGKCWHWRYSQLCKQHDDTRSSWALHWSSPCPVRLVPLGLLVCCDRRFSGRPMLSIHDSPGNSKV